MKLRDKVLTMIVVVVLPAILVSLFKTESTTKFLWWEHVIGVAISSSMYYTWFEFWFKKIFKK